MSTAYILIRTVRILFSIINIAILIRCLLSWIPMSRDNAFSNILYLLTEPILGPIRHLFNKSPIGGSGIDFSPILAIILLSIAENILLSLIISIFI